jgi:hypothetical protein
VHPCPLRRWPAQAISLKIDTSIEEEEYDRWANIDGESSNLGFFFIAMKNMPKVYFRPGFNSLGYKRQEF